MNEPKIDHIVVVGGMSWGKGNTLETAIANWKREYGSSLRVDRLTLHFRMTTEDAYVDGMGTLYAKRMERLPDVVMTRKDFDIIWGGADHLTEMLYPVSDRIDEVEDREVQANGA